MLEDRRALTGQKRGVDGLLIGRFRLKDKRHPPTGRSGGDLANLRGMSYY